MTGDLGAELFSEKAIQDPYPLYTRMHDAGPVHRIGDSDFHAVCSWDAVTEAVGRADDFSSNLTGTMLYQPDGTIGVFGMDGLGGPTQVLAIADDPVHAAHRRLLVPIWRPSTSASSNPSSAPRSRGCGTKRSSGSGSTGCRPLPTGYR